MRRLLTAVVVVTTLGCERKSADAGAQPSASVAPPPSALSDEARLLALQEQKAAVLEKAEQTCKGLGQALAAFEKEHAAENAAIMAGIRAKKAAGQTSPPLTAEENARFQRSKKVIVETYKRCVEDSDFVAAMGSPP